jgi:hypothetical protein
MATITAALALTNIGNQWVRGGIGEPVELAL